MDQKYAALLVLRLEGVRIAEGLKKTEFVKHFGISTNTYYWWLKCAKSDAKGKQPQLHNVERGLNSLGYDYHIINTKREVVKEDPK